MKILIAGNPDYGLAQSIKTIYPNAEFCSRSHGDWDLTQYQTQRDFCASWQGKMDDKVPKLLACGRTCGTDYEFSSAYGSNKRILGL